MNPGDVNMILKKYLPSIGHDKFVVCICPASKSFFFINTDKNPYASDSSQILVLGKLELKFLDHSSFIDTFDMQTFNDDAITHSIHKGSLTPLIRKRIRDSLPSNEGLTQEQIELVEANLK